MDFAAILEIVISLLTLTILEIVLGVDNLVFIAVASSQLPKHQQKMARRLGLLFALVTRLILLASVLWLIGLTKPLFYLFQPFSFRDIFLILGGIFLLYKATQEIHSEMETKEKNLRKVYRSVLMVIIQIGILDIVFSLDSIFTAIGMTTRYWVMSTAIFIAILTMITLSEPLAKLIEKKPTIKMLALSFLILIGMVLVADGFKFHIPREYIYFSISFSLFVEILNNIVASRKNKT